MFFYWVTKKNEMQPLEDSEREMANWKKVKVRAGGGGGVLNIQVGVDGVQIWIVQSQKRLGLKYDTNEWK